MSLDPVQLRRTGEDLIAIADTISAHSAYVRSHEGRSEVLDNDHRLATLASVIYQSRRKRSAHLAGSLFAEPAWDMLLDLFVSSVQGRRLSVTSLCIASDVPPTTALRWLADLEEHQLAERRPVPHDRRVSEVLLTDRGRRLMRACLSDCLPVTRV